MPLKKYTARDFLMDDHFLRWVKAPDEELQAYWRQYVQWHPEASEPMQQARKMIIQLNFEQRIRSDADKIRIKARIDQALAAETKRSFKPKPIKSDESQPLWLMVAAGISGLIFLLGAYLFFTGEEMSTYSTAYGETLTITLPDQSKVTLNANSRLSLYEEQWIDATERKVWLEGEAFFDVKEKATSLGKAAKFIVHSRRIEVEVLGTSFNVNSRHQQTKVVLSSGKIKLNIKNEQKRKVEEVYMEPGELVLVDEQAASLEKKMVDPERFVSWKENRLIFKDTPLFEIIRLLEDNYGYKVRLEDEKLLSKSFTGAAPADDIEILLDKLSLIYQINISKNGYKLKLKSR